MMKLMGSTLLLLALALPTGCGKSEGGGPIADVCDSYCAAISICNPQDAEKQCIDRCRGVFDKVDDKEDGPICIAANLDSFICATNLECFELNQFLSEPLRATGFVKMRDGGEFICEPSLPLDCCEQELVDVVESCPNSFQFAPGG